ncbi:hypothetical protein [Chromohalobacter israelensis]|uniref:hypothetical protein n=1 Tax=Chromohalobacter israelensis TaxID=141390 RepID=UPI0015C4ADAE|nr:hypothetical protein [Chromohalobacter salexigens]NWO54757.1 hypothetical protein [Chromohalobacter salexigens]
MRIASATLDVTTLGLLGENHFEAMAVPGILAQLTALGEAAVGDAWKVFRYHDEPSVLIRYMPPYQGFSSSPFAMTSAMEEILRIAAAEECTRLAITLGDAQSMGVPTHIFYQGIVRGLVDGIPRYHAMRHVALVTLNMTDKKALDTVLSEFEPASTLIVSHDQATGVAAIP